MILSKVGQPETKSPPADLNRSALRSEQYYSGATPELVIIFIPLNSIMHRDGFRLVLLCWCKDMAKDFARSFYSSKQWQDCRNEYAKRRHHLCEDCLRRGIYKPGVIVHHIEELTPFNITNPEITLGFDNLELLCRECHLREHDLEGGRWAKVNAAKKKGKRDARRFSVDEYGRVTARSPQVEVKNRGNL